MDKFRSLKAKRHTTTEDEWDCPKCTFKNSAKSFKCSICLTTRGTSTRKGTVNSQVAQQRELEEIIARQRLAQQRAKSKTVRDFSMTPSSPSARASTSRISRSPDRISMETSSIRTSSSIPSTSSYRLDRIPRHFSSPTPSTSRVSDSPRSESPSDLLPAPQPVLAPKKPKLQHRPMKRLFSPASAVDEPSLENVPRKKKKKRRPQVPDGFVESPLENQKNPGHSSVFNIRYGGVVMEFQETILSDLSDAE